MREGIYILGNDNDRIIEDTIAFLNSLFTYEKNYPVTLIPYNDEYHKIASILREKFDIDIYDNQNLFNTLELHSKNIFGRTTHLIRKFACWFGPYDKFIFFDSDIIILKDLKDVFDLLNEYDLVCDGSIRKLGIRTIFTKKVFERGILPKQEISGLFNTGFFASKKGVLNYNQLMSILEEAATISDIFEHVGDQPLINYVTLRAIPRRANLRLLMPAITDIWGGVEGLKIRKDKIYLKDGMPVRYIHWAGMKPAYRRPYVRLWLRYRYPGKKETLKRRLFLFYYLFLRSKRYLLYLLSGMKKKIGR